MIDYDQVLALRNSGGYASESKHAVVEIDGADAAAFLQTRLSNDVRALADGGGQLTALLDRKAYVLAFMALYRLSEQRFWIIFESFQMSTILEQLEKYHFNEKVSFRHLSSKALWTIQGPKSELFISLGLQGQDYKRPGPGSDELAFADACLWGKDVCVIRRSVTGEPGFLLVADGDDTADTWNLFENKARELGLIPLSEAALNTARIEAGLLQYGIDFNADILLPETGLENIAASYTKGCFQGQEVLARVRSFGAPRKGMVGLRFQSNTDGAPALFARGSQIRTTSGAEIGNITSSVDSPTLQCPIALASVAREYRVPDERLRVRIDDSEYDVMVVTLPFYQAAQKKQRAIDKYNAGLSQFATGSEEKAVELLREAIELDPIFADAYESLGVILSRHEKLDEAVSLMKRLEQLDPESVMAHSNLSVFYMQQGNKELAEEEKAKAMSIRMSQMAREVAAQQKEKEDVERRKQEAESRMELFRQVLAIDADDFLANSGMGSALVDAERYAEALPYLENAIAIKDNHTVTYVALGKTYELLGYTDKAIETYRKGISVAAQRGEGTPLKEMQARLSAMQVAPST